MTAAVGADDDASVVSNTPPRPTVDAANTMSHTCSAALANPRSLGAAYRNVSTPMFGIASPIPNPAITHSGAAAHAGPQLGAISTIAANAVATTRYPALMNSALGTFGSRPCHHDAPAHPSAPTVS